MNLQPDADSPEDIAAARAALDSADPRSKAKAIYERMVAEGRGVDEIRSEMAKVLRPAQAQGAPQAPTPAGAIGGVAGALPGAVAGASERPASMPAPGAPLLDTSKATLDPQTLIERQYENGPVGRFQAGVNHELTGLVRGARQIWNTVTNDDEDLDSVNAASKRAEDYWKSKEPVGSGISLADVGRGVGNAMAFGGMAGPAARAMGPILAPAAVGALSAGLQPTSEDGGLYEHGVNAAVGGALGAAGAKIGDMITGAVGRADPRLREMANSLRERGVSVPPGYEYKSPMADVARAGSAYSSDSTNNSLSRVVADKLGMQNTDHLSNEVLEGQKGVLGRKIGQLYEGTEAKPDRSFFNTLLDTGRKYQMAIPAGKGDQVMKQLDRLMDMSAKGTPITGEQYQAIRTELTRRVTDGGAVGQAYHGMRQALDDLFESQADPVKSAALRSQYRLASILRQGGGIPNEGLTVKQLSRRLESAVNGGKVDPGLRRLVKDAADFMPKARITPAALSAEADVAAQRAAESLMNSRSLVGLLTAAGKKAMGPVARLSTEGTKRTQITPQEVVNNETLRSLMSSLLRSAGAQNIPKATEER